jgi:molybdopterin molybdotransferase
MSNQAIQTQASCRDDYDPESLSVAAALQRIDSEIVPVPGREQVALRAALGRILAETVYSPIDVPAHTNSAMDGYALRSEDLPTEGVARFSLLAGSSFAGRPFPGVVGPGECVRIMTGAVMPEGGDTVVMQEHAEVQGQWLRIGGGYRPGENVRAAGEDLRRGQAVLSSGTRLQPAALGVLASLGVAEVSVRRRPRVAFFSTGDELRSIGESLGPGDIYDSNRYTLYGMLQRLGLEAIDMGVVRDRREELQAAFREAGEQADALITSGGVSVGEADFVKETLGTLGRVSFWKIAMKPGRPLAFGRIGESLFFGLPGNPVSVMVTFYQFVQPALRRLMGERDPTPVLVPARLTERLRKRRGRTELQRGVLSRDESGALCVRSTGEQGSGILSSVSRANCFIVLPEESTGGEPGASVLVQPFDGLV